MWAIAGVLAERFGTGRCAYCRDDEYPAWTGRRDINGTVMVTHVHRKQNPWNPDHLISRDDPAHPGAIAGNYDYDTGGILEPADLLAIVALRNNADALLDCVAVLRLARDELARWGWGDMHYGQQPQEPAVVAMVAEMDAALARLDEADRAQ